MHAMYICDASMFVQLEEAAKQLCSTRMEMQQAHSDTDAARHQVQRMRQLHAAANEVICALRRKEADKRTSMVAEHVFSHSYCAVASEQEV